MAGARAWAVPTLGVASVVIVASIGMPVGLNLAGAELLALLTVVFVAVYAGFWQATLVSSISVVCLNWFFVLSGAGDLVTLAVFEGTALLVSRVSHNANLQARMARQQRAEMQRLYDVSRQIPAADSAEERLELRIVRLIQRHFVLTAVVLFDAASDSLYSIGAVDPGMERGARNTFSEDHPSFDSGSKTWFQPLRFGFRVDGALALRGDLAGELSARALASLAVLAMERARSSERETEARIAWNAEQLRTAVLDALAHEFKTPLTTIRTASSGLLEMGSLDDSQREMVKLIDDEIQRLNVLATTLLQTAQLEDRQIGIRRTPVRIPAVIDSVLASTPVSARGIRVTVSHRDDLEFAVADADLLAKALRQLLENAYKYSEAGSAVQIYTYMTTDYVVIAVTNKGPAIPQSEKERVFDRFYRSAAVQNEPSGTGLGLSVAKTLVEAQRGRIWVESNEGVGNTFYVSLPARYHYEQR